MLLFLSLLYYLVKDENNKIIKKESSLTGKTIHCGCINMGSSPISRYSYKIIRSLNGKILVCGTKDIGSIPIEFNDGNVAQW